MLGRLVPLTADPHRLNHCQLMHDDEFVGLGRREKHGYNDWLDSKTWSHWRTADRCRTSLRVASLGACGHLRWCSRSPSYFASRWPSQARQPSPSCWAMGALDAAMSKVGSASISLTYVTGALVKLGQGAGNRVMSWRRSVVAAGSNVASLLSGSTATAALQHTRMVPVPRMDRKVEPDPKLNSFEHRFRRGAKPMARWSSCSPISGELERVAQDYAAARIGLPSDRTGPSRARRLRPSRRRL